jgi:outer membrane protein TolC
VHRVFSSWRHRWTGGLLAVGALAGCHTAPLHTASAPFVEAAPPQESHDRSLAAFSELPLDAVIDTVLARNPSLVQMTAAWEIANSRYPQVTALDDPMLGAMIAPASFGSNAVDAGYRIELSQKIPFPGKRRLRGENARADASAAAHDIDDMRLQLIEAAKTAYYDYYLVHRAIAVNTEGLRLLTDGRKNAEVRYKTGQGLQQDLLQADVELGKQRERQLILERQRRVAIARLNTLMHADPESPLPPPPAELRPHDSVPDAASLRELAIANRPDLQAARNRVAAEQAALALAHKEFCPDVEVAGAYDTIMGNGPTRDLAPQVGVRINLPTQRSRRWAQVHEAEAKVAQRNAELAKLTDQVAYDVATAHAEVVESERIVALYDHEVLPAARSNVREARTAYVTGKVPFSNLLEAQRNVVMLEDRYHEAVADLFRRRARLERNLGVPLPTTAPAPRPRLGMPEELDG